MLPAWSRRRIAPGWCGVTTWPHSPAPCRLSPGILPCERHSADRTACESRPSTASSPWCAPMALSLLQGERPVTVDAQGRPLRVLSFTTLYPNAEKPQYCVFVENRLRQLLASGEVSARVLAPVPYFPFRFNGFGNYAGFARVPWRETRFAIEIDHPRYLAIPKLGMSVAPYLLYAAARNGLARLLSSGERFDIIDA